MILLGDLAQHGVPPQCRIIALPFLDPADEIVGNWYRLGVSSSSSSSTSLIRSWTSACFRMRLSVPGALTPPREAPALGLGRGVAAGVALASQVKPSGGNIVMEWRVFIGSEHGWPRGMQWQVEQVELRWLRSDAR